MKYCIVASDRVRKIVDQMTWRALIDQACCPQVLKESMLEHEFGAAFFQPDTHDSLKKRIAIYRKACSIPPLVTTDMEAGPGNMITDGTRFPSMMACARSGREDYAYEMGRIAAIEGREVGFNWSLAPCVDIVHEPDNPIVSVRSAGSNVDLVIRITSAYARGMQENGMAATAKHFPGDGFGKYDQHLTTSVNPLSREEWRALSGRAFKALIENGIMAIMPGHISLPSFDTEDDYLKCCPPATLSRRLMVDLLRGELGFGGMIVSDAVNMGGMVNFMNYYDACATFWENGGDCLLFPKIDETFYIEMEKRLETGMLSINTLKDRVTRILGLKEQMGLLDGNSSENSVTPDFAVHREMAGKIAAGAIEVVRDRQKIIPFELSSASKVLHLIISNSYQSHQRYIDYFSEVLCRRCECKIMIDPGPDAIFNEIQNGHYDLVVCSTGSQVEYGINTVRLYGSVARNMMHGWMRLGTPVIFVNHFNPGITFEYDTTMDTLINTYRSTNDSIDALADIIFKHEQR